MRPKGVGEDACAARFRRTARSDAGDAGATFKTAAPFARSGCFKAANDFLEEISRGPVDWDL